MPVALAIAKQHLRVRHDDEDALIAQYIAAAERHVEQATGKLLTRREVTQTFRGFSWRMPLFWGPDPADVTVTYTDADEAEQDIADARIVQGWLHPAESWPASFCPSVVSVTYTAGYADGEVPEDLISAILIGIERLYERHADPRSDEAMKRAFDDLLQPFCWVLV